MAIDGIGRGGGPPKIDGQPGKAERAGGAKFSVPTAAAPLATTGAQATNAAEVLKQVRSGEMSLNAYLEVRVDEAVEHLDGSLTSEQMDYIKQQLRNQLHDDPVLTDLVRRATGKRPEPQEE